MKTSRLKLVLAFGAIYLIWGSTFLAIRFAIETIPPFFMVGTRYLIAGSVLYAFARLTGAPPPERFHWKGAVVVGGLLLTLGNGGVVWAEQLVASGLAALLVSTEPLWVVVFDSLRTGERPSGQVAAGLVLGILGMAFLLDPAEMGTGGRVAWPGVLAILCASLSWALGSVYSRTARLPASAALATAMQMLAGGASLVLLGFATGEPARLDLSSITLRSILAVAYLAVFGSLIGLTAFVWLLRVTTPARVSTHAFVNPIVAVFLGWLFASEPITGRMLVAGGLVVVAVVAITTGKRRAAERRVEPELTPAAVTNGCAEP